MTGAKNNGSDAAETAAGYKVIGTRPIRQDGADKVTGSAIFGADVKLPGLLHGRVLRSPYAHARIKSIDTSRAGALPGVMAVITARDIWSLDRRGGPREEAVAGARYANELDEAGDDSTAESSQVDVGLKYLRDHCLAGDKVLYCGHPVAAVAATDQFIAEEAVELIDVEYEPLPPVFDGLEAMKDSSPLLHEDLITVSLGQSTGKPSNVAQHFRYVKGDPDQGFAGAEVIVEREFHTTAVHQGYIEAHVATASWSPDGNLTVWCPHQGHFVVRDDLAKLLRHPAANLHVIPTEVGGGFGGKFTLYVQPLAALLARKAGRPVRVSMSRAETFEATGPAASMHIKVKAGATRDGRLTAVAVEIVGEAGAFPGSSAGGAARCIFGPYDIPDGQIDGFDVVVNTPKVGAYRAPGSTQATFAAEGVIDEICEQIGMDPLEFRLKNAAKEGSRSLLGMVHPRVGFVETMQATLAHEHYRAPLGGPNRGRGIACGWWSNFGGVSSCTLNVNGDGTVNLTSGSVDLSGTRTSVAMQVAEVLDIDLRQIHSTVPDTDSVGYTLQSGGSRTTYATGIAAIDASHEALRQMKGRAALLWRVDSDTVSYAGGVFTTSADDAKRLTFKEIAAKLPLTGGPISISTTVNPLRFGSTVGAHIVDVEVDPETGKVQILRYTAIQDAGQAIHPSQVESQIQGGVAQGIGWALWEGYQLDGQGRLLNKGFLDYKMPTALDLPPIDAVIVEVPNPGHPYGVRGVGEIPIVPPPAAIASAIYHATGVRLRQLPMTPARILQATGVIA